MLAVIHYNQFYFYHHIKCHALYTCWLVGIKGEQSAEDAPDHLSSDNTPALTD